MYLFLYKNTKHDWPSWRKNGKYNASSTYGQFNLTNLRNGLRKQYTIYGYGNHPIHSLLRIFNLEERLKGHLIEIKDPRLAVWLKLNYDQVTNPGTSYEGMYSNIREEDYCHWMERARKIQDEKDLLRQESNILKYLTQSTKSYADKTMSRANVEIHEKAARLEIAARLEYNRLTSELSMLNDETLRMKSEIEAYLEKHSG